MSAFKKRQSMHAEESISPEPMPLPEDRMMLTRMDVQQLLDDNSIDSRVEIAAKIASQYTKDMFSAHEIQYAEQIFRLLMRDSEMRVRLELSRKLEHADNAPRDVILTLANDHEKVAAAILRSNQVLSDADLIRIVESSQALGKMEAIASRMMVSSRVSKSLIETHYPQVVKTLLKNSGAQIAPKEYNTVIEDHQQDAAIIEILAAREALPLPVVEKIIQIASDNVASTLKQKYAIDIEPMRRQSQESMLLQLLPVYASDEEISNTINQMHAFGRLTPSVLVSALCRGRMRFFEIGMAKLSDIPKANAHKLIHDRGSYGFEAIYEKAQMPASLFEAVRLLLKTVFELEGTTQAEKGSKLYIGLLVDSMQRAAADQPIENLSYLIELIRRKYAAIVFAAASS